MTAMQKLDALFKGELEPTDSPYFETGSRVLINPDYAADPDDLVWEVLGAPPWDSGQVFLRSVSSGKRSTCGITWLREY
jgi:hypothetical protein